MQRRFPFALLLLAGLLVHACGAPRAFLGELSSTVPRTPQSEYDAVVAAALRHAFIAAQDIPAHSRLADSRHIVVSNTTSVLAPFEATRRHRHGETLGPLDTLTAHALPASDDVQFFLRSPETIQHLADAHGEFLFAQVGQVEIEGDEATVELALTWAAPRNNNKVYLSGGGYALRLRHEGDAWSFVEAIHGWTAQATSPK